MSDPFATAMELLLADHPSREEVERAGELFEQASSQGRAEASERCAIFEAFGMARPQSWSRALDFLELAARQGLCTAQEQLLLLSDNGADPQVPPDADEAFWHNVRSGIDAERRIQPGQKVALSNTPRIRVME